MIINKLTFLILIFSLQPVLLFAATSDSGKKHRNGNKDSIKINTINSNFILHVKDFGQSNGWMLTRSWKS